MSYGGRPVLAGINLRIDSGEVVGLVGRNGAGKSTLIRALLGLIEVDGGAAHVFGEPALSMTDKAKESLAYVPQQPSALEWMLVDDFFGYLARLYPDWDAAYVEAELKRAQIPLRQKLVKLSPGERQRVELIRAFAARPRLLVLDEPAAALDPVSRRDLLRDIAVRAGDSGMTVLFSTHIISDLERVASRVLFLHKGSILLDTAVDELRERFRRVVVRPEALSMRRVPGEIHRRDLPDGAVSLVVERAAGAGWPSVADMDESAFQPCNLEDLFIELVP